jgi:hypothetical protein
MTQSPIKIISADSITIYNRLRQCQIGEIVTYKELSSLIGRNILKTRGNLYTAMRRAARDDGMAFATVLKLGVKCISDKEIVHEQRGTISRIRRAARKIEQRVSLIKDFVALPVEDQTEALCSVTWAHLVRHSAGAGAQKRLREKCKGESRSLPIGIASAVLIGADAEEDGKDGGEID